MKATKVVFSKNGCTYVVHVDDMSVGCYSDYKSAEDWLKNFGEVRKLVINGNVEFWGK